MASVLALAMKDTICRRRDRPGLAEMWLFHRPPVQYGQ